MVEPLSISRGIPLDEEQGIGALTLGGWLREVTAKHGPKEAAVLWHGDMAVRWTYDQLWDESMRVARALVACGLGKGERVGILATNRHEFLSATFGTALAGGVAATISTFFTATELDEVLKLSGVSVLLVERHVLKKDFGDMLVELEPAFAGSGSSKRYPFLHHIAFIDSDDSLGSIEGRNQFRARCDAISPAQIEARAAQVSPADPGVIFFSSGSTGKAKGVLSAHRGVCLQLWRWPIWYQLKPDIPPRTWSANGFFWSGNFSMAIGGTLAAGGSLILQRWFDAEEALTLMEKERANMLHAWPHQWSQLVEAPNYASVDLSAMHYLDYRSPIASHPTIQTDWMEPRHAFGNTETFTLMSTYPAGTTPEEAGNSHGLPTAGTTIRIVDPLTSAVVPIGERGEICVKGPTLMLGYLGVPLADSLDDDGYFRCNDGGFIDAQGRLTWEGRLNDIIKTGGANVSPVEIDDVIRKHSQVKLAQTVGVPHETLGEIVVTCIVPHLGSGLDEATVQAFAKATLASYKVPRRVLFFADNEIELTGSAKIKTADLKTLAAARLGDANGG
jgi:fatty-acyl-CoA synthase